MTEKAEHEPCPWCRSHDLHPLHDGRACAIYCDECTGQGPKAFSPFPDVREARAWELWDRREPAGVEVDVTEVPRTPGEAPSYEFDLRQAGFEKESIGEDPETATTVYTRPLSKDVKAAVREAADVGCLCFGYSPTHVGSMLCRECGHTREQHCWDENDPGYRQCLHRPGGKA